MSGIGLMLRLKFFMSNMLFMTRWKTFMSCGSVKGLEEYLRLDGYWLKMMGGEMGNNGILECLALNARI